ncbi:hypothetical protein [Ferrimonas aestuarii]|uniref:Immunity protein 50 n=1 Tax=Ferrimonas aestuarii TaxID=2569539 RepID=A0A4U1BRB9_9GAMM|nr:hypothetical protein [Ferrimonas aestuarii]TKB57607.1 hypothetical protein FCL42_04860 [Ferrimonas aestuarii]
MEVMDWRELQVFTGIDLNDSFVISWSLDKTCLVFELEASIWPESPAYKTPLANEYTCYRRMSLIFDQIESVDGLKPVEDVKPTSDPDMSKDYGCVDTLATTKFGYIMSGEFGVLKIVGGTLSLQFHT